MAISIPQLRAQEVDSLSVVVSKLYKNGEYNKALVIALQMPELAARGTDTAGHANSYAWQAVLYKQLKDFDNAEKAYRQASTIFKNFRADSLQSYASIQNSLGVLYANAGKYEPGETAYLEARKVYRLKPGQASDDYKLVISNLMQLYNNWEKLDKLTEAYAEQVKVLQLRKENSDSTYAATQNILGVLSFKLGKYPEAEAAYLAGAKVYREVLGLRHPLYLTVLNNLKLLYEPTGATDSLVTTLQRILEVQEATIGASSTAYALTLNTIAVNKGKLGDGKGSESFYKKSLEIMKINAGTSDPNYNVILNNLASQYNRSGRVDEAIALHQEALKNLQAELPKTTKLYADALNRLGVLFVNRDRDAEAVACLEKAFQLVAADSSSLALKTTIRGNLLIAYTGVSENRKIIAFYLEDVPAAEKDPGGGVLALLFNKIGLQYQHLGRQDSAQFYFAKSSERYGKYPPKNYNDHKIVLNNLVSAYAARSNAEGMKSVFNEILRLIEKNAAKESDEYALQLNIIAVAMHKLKKYSEAETYYRASLEAYKNVSGERTRGYVQTLSNLATFYSVVKDPRAEDIFTKALQLSKGAFSDTSNLYIEALHHAARLYGKKRRTDTAWVLFNHAMERATFAGKKQLQAISLTELADIAFDQVKYDQAAEYYQQGITLFAASGDTLSSNYVTALVDLARTYHKQGRYAQSEQAYAAALKISEPRIRELTVEYLRSINGLGTLFGSQGRYSETEAYKIRALDTARKYFGETHRTTSTYYNNLAGLYLDKGLFEKSRDLYLRSLEITKIVAGDEPGELFPVYNNLANVYGQLGNKQKAEEYYTLSLDARKQLGENSLEYAEGLHSAGAYYNNQGNYALAEQYLDQCLRILTTSTGTISVQYANLKATIAALYNNLARYAAGLAAIEEAISITQSIYGGKSLQFADALMIRGFIQTSLSDYSAAEKTYQEIAAIRLAILGPDHIDYGTILQSLSELYRKMGEYEKALPIYLQTVSIYKNSYGTANPKYATTISNLALLYMTMGKYDQSEPLFLEASNIWKTAQGDKSLDYAVSLNNLAQFYTDIAQYEKAVLLFQQATALRKLILGENHPDYAAVISNMAILYSILGLKADAEKLNLQALEITRKVNGEQSPEYAIRLNNLSSLYSDAKDFVKAEEYLRGAIDIWKARMGEFSVDYATALNNFGVLYVRSGRPAEAKASYLKVVEIREKLLGLSHPDLGDVLDNLYRAYMQSGEYASAEKVIQRLGKISVDNLTATFAILSEKEKSNFLESKVSLLEDFNSLLYVYPAASAQTRETAFNLLLKLKSLTLSETKSVRESVQASKDSTITKLYSLWLSDKAYLAKQYGLSKDQRDKNLATLEQRAETTEKELTRRSASFGSGQAAALLTFRDVRKNLAKDEAAIEFVSFNYYNKKWTDSVIYAAYLLRPTDSIPQFIPLCEARKLSALFAAAGKNSASMVNSFYRGIEVDNTGAAVLGDSLYNLVWKPLEPFLNGYAKVSYAPAGKLYAVAFNALPIGDKKLLLDKYRLQQYTSTRDIVFRQSAVTNTGIRDIALFGDATFSMDSLQLSGLKRSSNLPSPTARLPKARGGSQQVWAELPGTLQEVNTIRQLFDQRKIKAAAFTEQAASEQNFKALNNHSPQVLHLATHGFFLPEPDKNGNKEGVTKYGLAEDPLMRSGLVLAGGNYAWAGNKPIDGIEDGILTAYEISQLNLKSTELVVLSACETALGDVKGSEGVFGLQRSFKLAGVKKLIVSLWQVPDKETAELMTSFYNYTFQGKPVSEAFALAQADMRKKYSPYYWAAFVVIE